MSTKPNNENEDFPFNLRKSNHTSIPQCMVFVLDWGLSLRDPELFKQILKYLTFLFSMVFLFKQNGCKFESCGFSQGPGIVVQKS